MIEKINIFAGKLFGMEKKFQDSHRNFFFHNLDFRCVKIGVSKVNCITGFCKTAKRVLDMYILQCTVLV